MDLGLDGKAAAVMAASQGLGRATAEALAAEGARVAICARTRSKLEQTAEEISAETGSEVVPIVADVSTPDGPAGFIEDCLDALGRLDVLVTNKGGPAPGTFDQIDDEGWQAGFELVVLSYVRAVRAALPHLVAGGGGAVVAIESTSVKQPIDNLLLSTALRPSVVATSKALARQHGEDGVRFNVVLPGSMATDRIEDLVHDIADRHGITPDQARQRRFEGIPLGRFGEPAELGRAIAFLASPAASYITGGVYPVDGGTLDTIY